MIRGLLALVAIVLALLVPRTTFAHTVGLSSGEYRVSGEEVGIAIVFARGELAALSADVDSNHDGTLDEAEVARSPERIGARLAPLVVVRTEGGARCDGALEHATPVEQDGVRVDLRYTCHDAPPRSVELELFAALPKGHRHLFRELRDGAPPRDDILFERHRSATLIGKGEEPRASEGTPTGWLAFVRLGLEHILGGYDHLVFLVGLVLVRGRARDYVATITAFTLAHSITLAIAVLGIFHPSPRFVEPAIALSIAYVGLESLVVRDARTRWRITFPFGLVHGFGFAGALEELSLPRARIPGALVAFNVGVEVGQLAVLAVVLPLVLLLTARHTRTKVVRALAIAVAGAGLVWFVARIA